MAPQPRVRTCLGVALGVVIGGFALGLQAAPDEFETLYDVAEGCPTEAWFTNELRMQLADEPAPAGKLGVFVARGESFRAAVDFQPAPGEPAFRRELDGPDCQEVLSALALGLALHWDQSTGTAAKTALQPPAATAVEVAVQSPAADTPPELARATAARPPTWVWSVTGGPGWRSGTNPTTDPFAAVDVELIGTGDGFSNGAYGVRFESTWTTESQGLVPEDDGNRHWASGWWLLGSRGCPWGKRLGRALSASLCVSASFGSYQASVGGASAAEGGMARVGLGPRLSLGVGHLHLVLGGGWEVPLVPTQVAFRGVPIFRQQAGLTLAIEAGFTTRAIQ